MQKEPTAPHELTLDTCREIIEFSENAFYIHDTNHVLTYLSPQVESILGYPLQEAFRNWQTFLTDNPANRKGIELTERAIKTGQRQPSYELELRRKDGGTVWVLVNEAPIVKDGKTTAIVGALLNITERKEAEERFRALVENAFDVIMIVDRNGERLYMSPNVVQMTGRGMETTINAPFDEFVHPDDRERVRKMLEKAVADPLLTVRETARIQHSDGHWLYVEAIARNRLDTPINGIVFNIRDITERKETQEKLNESEERYRTLFESNPEAIIIHDGRTLIFANSAGLRMVKAERAEDVVGKPINTFLPPELMQSIRERVEKMMKSGKPAGTMETPLRRLDGTTIDIEFVSAPLVYHGKPAVQVISRDISERKEAERQIREKNEELERFNRLMVGRELRMVELKEELESLKKELADRK